jgi:hypothetical protein
MKEHNKHDMKGRLTITSSSFVFRLHLFLAGFSVSENYNLNKQIDIISKRKL